MKTKQPDIRGANHPLFGIRGKNNPNYGKRRTPEQKKRIGESREYKIGKENHIFGRKR